MSTTLGVPWRGVGAWLWYADLGGSTQQIIAVAQAAHLGWLVEKYSDGAGWGDESNPTIFRDQFRATRAAFAAAGRAVGAYGYLYLVDPVGEAQAIAQAVADGADFLVFDVEYEAIGRMEPAARFFTVLWGALPRRVPLAFAPDIRILVGNAPPPWSASSVNLMAEPWPWQTFLAHCDAVMPQLYSTDFGVSMSEAFGLVQAYRAAVSAQGWDDLPVVPILPATASVAEVVVGLRLAQQMGLPGVSLWREDDMPSDLQEAIARFAWGGAMDESELAAIGQQIFHGGAGVDFNPTAALTAVWIQAWRDGHYLGRPRGPEFDAGRWRCQEFERGIAWAEKANWANRGYDLRQAVATQ